MKTAARVSVALITILLPATAMRISARSHPSQASDLVVHEWGTFTSVAGEDGTAVDWDALGCKSDLPKFVYDHGYRGLKWSLSGTVRMETPVMYFYSPQRVEARVDVEFPGGLITEWYPKADYKVSRQNGSSQSTKRLPADLNGIDTSLRGVKGGIVWSHVIVQPGTAPIFPKATRPDRYYAARETDAAPLAVEGEHEKFLFYRGVGRFQVPLSARLAGEGDIAVENRGATAVPTVILFENRAGRVGYRRLDQVDQPVTVESPSLDGSLPTLLKDLEAELVGQGLFLKEAHAMVETWRDSWFEEGSRLIYILPQSIVDAILPLHIEPVPSRTTRVFVGRIELLTPMTTQSVEQAMAKGDLASTDKYGRFLGPILTQIESRNPSRARQVERFRGDVAKYRGTAWCHE